MSSINATSEIAKGKEAILSILENAELEQPTDDTTDDNATVDTPSGEPKPSRTLKVKQGDRDIELEILTDDVDASALNLGFLAEADYRRKTMELADIRKNAQAHSAALELALSEARQMISVDMTSLEADSELQQTDPEEYLKRFNDLTKRSKQYQGHKEKLEAAKAESTRQRQDVETELLSNSLPSWLDEPTRNEDMKRIGAQLTSLGFSEQEIGEQTDHRIILMARKAALYDEIQAKDISSKRDRTPSKSISPSSKRASQESEAERGLREKLGQTGKLKDAASLFQELLKR